MPPRKRQPTTATGRRFHLSSAKPVQTKPATLNDDNKGFRRHQGRNPRRGASMAASSSAASHSTTSAGPIRSPSIRPCRRRSTTSTRLADTHPRRFGSGSSKPWLTFGDQGKALARVWRPGGCRRTSSRYPRTCWTSQPCSAPSATGLQRRPRRRKMSAILPGDHGKPEGEKNDLKPNATEVEKLWSVIRADALWSESGKSDIDKAMRHWAERCAASARGSMPRAGAGDDEFRYKGRRYDIKVSGSRPPTRAPCSSN